MIYEKKLLLGIIIILSILISGCVQQKNTIDHSGAPSPTEFHDIGTTKNKEICNGKICINGQEVPCPTDFKMAFAYLYENDTDVAGILQKLENAKKISEKEFNMAGRERVHLDLSYPVVAIKITDSNKKALTSSRSNADDLDLKYKEIMKEFYKSNPDVFDFVSIFTNFKIIDTTGTSAYHLAVKNNILGIGAAVIDHSKEYGSNGTLLGINYMGATSYIFDKNKPIGIGVDEKNEDDYDGCFIASNIKHETGHQWAAYIGDIEGSKSNFILQNSFASHWFGGLNLNYDVVGGMSWRDNENGTFTIVECEDYCLPNQTSMFCREKMSNITLYLMGAINATDVKPILSVLNWNYSENPSWSAGLTIASDKKYITIQEIIDREGDRKCIKPS